MNSLLASSPDVESGLLFKTINSDIINSCKFLVRVNSESEKNQRLHVFRIMLIVKLSK